MKKYEKMNYLVTETGAVLYTKKQILDYLKLVSKTLKEIRKTPKFAEEFSNGDLSEYYSIEERLKLSTEHGDKLDLEQTYQWIEKNKVR